MSDPESSAPPPRLERRHATMAEIDLPGDGTISDPTLPRTEPIVHVRLVEVPPVVDPEATKPNRAQSALAPPDLGPAAARLLSAVAAAPAMSNDRTVSLSPRAGNATPGSVKPPSSTKLHGALPPGCRPRLRVLRGMRVNAEYPIYDGTNIVGRRDENPVDIDLEDQEPADRIWSSRRHAVITFTDGQLVLEDLNSLNGTFVNRHRLPANTPKPLGLNDVIQIGTIQLKVTV